MQGRRVLIICSIVVFVCVVIITKVIKNGIDEGHDSTTSHSALATLPGIETRDSSSLLISSSGKETEPDGSASAEMHTSNKALNKAAIKGQTDSSAPRAPFVVGESRAITGKEDFISPRWSLDGLDILVTGAKYKGLYLVAADGSSIRQLSDEDGIGYDVKWSLDGTKLIVTKEGETRVFDLTGQELNIDEIDAMNLAELVYARDDNIYLRDPETGNEVALTGKEADAYYNPELSPDGTHVVYEGLTTGIHIQNLETGETISVGTGNHPQWLSDGKGIIYDVTQDDGERLISGDIYFAYTDGSGVINLTMTPDLIETNPRISPCGRFLTYEIDGQIFVARLEDIVD